MIPNEDEVKPDWQRLYQQERKNNAKLLKKVAQVKSENAYLRHKLALAGKGVDTL